MSERGFQLRSAVKDTDRDSAAFISGGCDNPGSSRRKTVGYDRGRLLFSDKELQGFHV